MHQPPNRRRIVRWAFAVALGVPVFLHGASLLLPSAAAEPAGDKGAAAAAPAETGSPAPEKPLVIGQVRDEEYLPGQNTSNRIADYSAIVKDGWYYPADGSYRLKIPALGSGKIDVLRRRWRKPDGTDVKFIDNSAYYRAVFNVEEGLKPAAEKLRKKYADYLATKDTKYEANVIDTRFGTTTETIAMNWVSTRVFPYDPPSINVSKEKMADVGPTVGISWAFWRDGTQYGLSMVMPVKRTAEPAAAFSQAKAEIKRFSDGLEFRNPKLQPAVEGKR